MERRNDIADIDGKLQDCPRHLCPCCDQKYVGSSQLYKSLLSSQRFFPTSAPSVWIVSHLRPSSVFEDRLSFYCQIALYSDATLEEYCGTRETLVPLHPRKRVQAASPFDFPHVSHHLHPCFMMITSLVAVGPCGVQGSHTESEIRSWRDYCHVSIILDMWSFISYCIMHSLSGVRRTWGIVPLVEFSRVSVLLPFYLWTPPIILYSTSHRLNIFVVELL